MDLRNGQITVGQVLSNPKARDLLRREFPSLMNHPMMGMAMNMTINQLLGFAAKYNIPQAKINQVLEQLKAL